MLHTKFVALALAALSLAVAGCGKSSKTESTATQAAATTATASKQLTTPSGPPLTRAEFISKAEVMCRRLKDRRASNRASTPQQVAEVATELGTFEQKLATELNSLIPPASLLSDWRTVILNAQTLANDTAKIGEYAGSGQLSTAAAHTVLVGRTTAEHQSILIATRDGITECNKNL